MSKNKIQKTYMFDKNVIKHSESNVSISSFAEWACDAYYSEFMSCEKIKLKIDSIKTELYFLEKQHEIMLRNEENLIDKVLDDKQIAWVSDIMIPGLNKYTFEGLYKRFCNKFNCAITRKQMRVILKYLTKKRGKL